MRIVRYILSSLIVLLAAALLLGSLRLHSRPDRSAQRAVSVSYTADDDGQALFPSFSAEAVTSVSIVTPQTAFDLRREDERMVSVNGQRGDHEVFATLLEQIAAISFTPTDPFITGSTPLLTLVIRQQGTEHSAVFYTDESRSELTRIVIGRGGTSDYGTTDGWRIGTLMLACEGMRVQDESGNETPFK